MSSTCCDMVQDFLRMMLEASKVTRHHWIEGGKLSCYCLHSDRIEYSALKVWGRALANQLSLRLLVFRPSTQIKEPFATRQPHSSNLLKLLDTRIQSHHHGLTRRCERLWSASWHFTMNRQWGRRCGEIRRFCGVGQANDFAQSPCLHDPT